MTLKIKEGSENYVGTVVEIKQLLPIEGADKIQKAIVFGNSVVVSIDVKVGSKMIYFNSGTKLNREFCAWNNLLTDAEQNKDKVPGYISHKQLRVKAIKLRGIISDGMLLPMSSLSLWLERYNELEVGNTFSYINDILVCEKYVVEKAENTSIQQPKTKQPKLKDLIEDKQFKFHTDTAHFARNLHKFNPKDNIIITRKYHGSSGILAHVLLKKPKNWFTRFLMFLKIPVVLNEYGFVWSSGKPKSQTPKGVESDSNAWTTNNQSFYKEDIWRKAYDQLKDSCEKGITLYFEIVGKGIQGDGYTYNHDYKILIYRVTQTNVDGHTYEFGWNEVKLYCDKYGLTYVDDYYQGKFEDFMDKELGADKTATDFLIDLMAIKYLDKSFPDCKIDEGICIRNATTNEIFKLKSPKFIAQESDMQEKEISNIEDEQ